MFLSKQVWTIAAARWRDAQTIEVLGAYILLRLFSIPPGGMRPCAGLVLFLEICFHHSGKSNPVEEIRFLEFFTNLI